MAPTTDPPQSNKPKGRVVFAQSEQSPVKKFAFGKWLPVGVLFEAGIGVTVEGRDIFLRKFRG